MFWIIYWIGYVIALIWITIALVVEDRGNEKKLIEIMILSLLSWLLIIYFLSIFIGSFLEKRG
jgi:hypothetical protein